MNRTKKRLRETNHKRCSSVHSKILVCVFIKNNTEEYCLLKKQASQTTKYKFLPKAPPLPLESLQYVDDHDRVIRGSRS